MTPVADTAPDDLSQLRAALADQFLPAVPEGLSKSLESYDAILVLGASAFTFHVSGDAAVLASGVPIYRVAADPASAAAARRVRCR